MFTILGHYYKNIGGASTGRRRRATSSFQEKILALYIPWINVLSNPSFNKLVAVDNILTEINRDLRDLRVRENPHDLLRLLELLGRVIPIKKRQNITKIVRKNVAMVVAGGKNSVVSGLSISTHDIDILEESTFHIMDVSERDIIGGVPSDRFELLVLLPYSVIINPQRVSFAVLRKDYLYTNDDSIVNSRIVSVSANVTLQKNEVIEIFFQPMRDAGPNERRACAYMDTGSNKWSKDGCTLIPGDGGTLDKCSCNHLSTFSQIITKKVATNLTQVISKIKRILRNSDTINLPDNKELLNEIDELFDKNQTSSELLTLLDNIAARSYLNGSYEQVTVNKNFGIIVADPAPRANVRGLIKAQGEHVFNKKDFVIFRNDSDDNIVSSEASEVVVVLPKSVSESRRRVSFVVFRNGSAFRGDGASAVNSRVISIKIDDSTTFHDGEVIEVFLQPMRDARPNERRACAHMDSNKWSQDGCALIPGDGSTLDKCICNHLSTFSQIITTKEANLMEVISKINLILQNTDTITLPDNKELLNEIDELFEKNQTSSELLTLLDDIAARSYLNGSYEQVTVNKNFGIIVADPAPEANVRGLIKTQGESVFNKKDFVIIRNDFDDNIVSSEANEVVVVLPESVSDSRRRVSFVVFRNDRAFSGDGASAVNSRVLSIKIDNTTTFHDREVIEIHLLPKKKDVARDEKRACAYWNIKDGDSARWSQDGCQFIPSVNGSLDMCQCNHLTSFAEVIVSKPIFSEENETALEIISVVGCCISVMGIIIIILTAVLFRSWRTNYSNKIWLQLAVSISVMSVMFLIVVFGRLESSRALCTMTGVALHYSVLSSFCWMLVAAVQSYREVLIVFYRDPQHKLLRAAAFAWGAPCAVIGVLLSINSQAYEAPFEEQAPSATFCYPSGLALWLAVYAPIALMLLTNGTIFTLIVRTIIAPKTIAKHDKSNEVFRSASVSLFLTFLFGLPWIFGLVSFNIVAAYFFTILSTFQGFILFVLIIVMRKNTRNLWLIKLKCTERNVTGSSFMMR